MGGERKNTKFPKITIAVLVACFYGIIIYSARIHLDYDAYLPREPDTKAGRTYKMTVQHGDIRYGNIEEFQAYNISNKLWVPALVIFLSIAVIHIFYKVDWRSGSNDKGNEEESR